MFPVNINAPDLTQLVNTLQNITVAINGLQQTVSRIFPLGLTASNSYSPPSISAGSQTTTSVMLSGSVLGMSAQAAFSVDLSGLTLTAYVSVPNTVTCLLYNGSSTTVALSSGTLTVWARSN